MPQKKRGGGDDTEDGDRIEQADVAAPKRQRVSLACDACRAARERCDGERPRCGTCEAQKRACSYTPTAKKRGVQTGYLRTIEMSLAWILYEEAPRTEDALLRLLQDTKGPLHKKGKAADKLHKKWTTSRVSKEIGLLLSGSTPPQPRGENSGNESDTDGSGEGLSSTFDMHNQTFNSASPFLRRERLETPRGPLLKLPKNWRKLFDIYFTYTHCWFPILSRDRVMETALAYPPEGIPGPSAVSDVAPSYAELWAVLSLASFQDATSGNPTRGSMSPKQIYATARGLIPSEESQFELPHLRALLLHSLVLIGQGADLAAWMLVGTATRLAMFLRGTGALYTDGLDLNETTEGSGRIALAACFVLDTIAATGLGQPASTHVGPSNVDAEALSPPAADECWSRVAGFGQTQLEHGHRGPHVQPLRTFQQLLKFCQVLRRGLDPTSLQSCHTTNAAESMAEVLDPVYSFCNSVIFGASTPPVPSAFLLQIAFLAMTTRLFQSFRGSLLSSLTEVVEACMSSFGPCGTPPLVVGLLGVVQRCTHLERMHETERTKWRTTLESLKVVWRGDNVRTPALPPVTDFEVQYSNARHIAAPRQLPTRFTEHQTPVPGYSFSHQATMSSNLQGFQLAQSMESPGTVQSRAIPSPSLSYLSSATGGPGPSSGMVGGVAGPDFNTQGIDYDAILEELGSIDCMDGLDMDPQFMTNLGFAPGCDLGEILQSEFGG